MAVVTVFEWQRVLRYRNGQLAAVLGPGRYRYRRRDTSLVSVDLRPEVLTVPGQDVLTADGITVKISTTMIWRVLDPAKWHAAAQHPIGLLYAAVQTALRDAVGAVRFDDLVASKDALNEALRTGVVAAAEPAGAGIERVVVKDVMLPAELRRAAAEAVLARERGRAELERARAETATLRALANSARLLEEHPALLHLRTVQAAAEPGNTVVLTPPNSKP
jgi:regulator of protease activity HflC (stomatin/prohibitin superfamily)